MEHEYYYRYHDTSYTSGPKVCLTPYRVIKKTPKGAWVDCGCDEQKFCLNGGGKRFAHETKELALESYVARKKRQHVINMHRAASAEICIRIADYMKKESNYLGDYEQFGEMDLPLIFPVNWR